MITAFWLGGGANENYMKVAKQFQKRQEKREDERAIRGLGTAKPYMRPRVITCYLRLLRGPT